MDAHQLLFGLDPTERVVAVEVGEDCATLFLRSPTGVQKETRGWMPWLYADREHSFDGARWSDAEAPPEGVWLRKLARFERWSAFRFARHDLQGSGVPFLALSSPIRQFLVATGVTLFKGMSYGDLHRMQIDIETTGLNPNEPDARLLMVAVSDNRGFEDALIGDEATILRLLSDLVQQMDPDTIEGHNLMGFDLPYLYQRALAVGVPLLLGRESRPLERGAFGSSWRSGRWSAYGRHLLDTMLAVQRFDVGRGELESYGLKQVAVALGISEPGRIVLDAVNMQRLVAEQPDVVREYALQDVRETRALAELVCVTDFYQTQMIPDSYQAVAEMGMGEKINALMHRAYLAAGHAIPLPKPSEEVSGGYTEVRRTGVLSPVVKADVQSLYPSIMDRFEIAPATDRLGVFLPMLRELTRRRIEAKNNMQGAEGQDRTYWDALQSSFKVLINSFYGYLGTNVHFNDPSAAAKVTAKGQEIVRSAAEEIERLGGQVIEVDTDGIYFVPPASVQGLTAEEEFVNEVARALPEGIRLVHDGSYSAMLSLKVKNYALLREDGRILYHGASLRSRADEPFGREFLASAARLLFQGRVAELSELYLETAARVIRGQIPIEQLVRRERVTEKTFRSPAKKRSKAVAEGLQAKVGDYVRVYEAKGGRLKTLQEYAQDENREHYLEKLYKFACRLEPVLGPEMEKVFPPPSVLMKSLSTEQPSLFDF